MMAVRTDLRLLAVLTVLLVAWTAQASGTLCVKRNIFGNIMESKSCPHGCCDDEDMCCDPPFYQGPTFVATILCSTAVPVVMGIVLCIVLRQRRRQFLARQQQLQTLRLAVSSYNNYPHVVNLSAPGGVQPMAYPMKPPTYEEVTTNSNTAAASNTTDQNDTLSAPPAYSPYPMASPPQQQQQGNINPGFGV